MSDALVNQSSRECDGHCWSVSISSCVSHCLLQWGGCGFLAKVCLASAHSNQRVLRAVFVCRVGRQCVEVGWNETIHTLGPRLILGSWQDAWPVDARVEHNWCPSWLSVGCRSVVLETCLLPFFAVKSSVRSPACCLKCRAFYFKTNLGMAVSVASEWSSSFVRLLIFLFNWI